MEPEEFYWIDANEQKENISAAQPSHKSDAIDGVEEMSDQHGSSQSPFSILPAVGGWFSSIAKQLVMSKDYFVQQLKKAEEFPHLDIDESPDECLEILRKHKDLPGKVHMHYIKPGETLETIAAYYGMDVELLKEINQIKEEHDSNRNSLFVYKTDRYFESKAILSESSSPDRASRQAGIFSENALSLGQDLVITGTLVLSSDQVRFKANEDEKALSLSHQAFAIDVKKIEKLLTSTVLPFPGQKMSQFGDLKYIHVIGGGKELHLMVPQHSLIIDKLEDILHMKLMDDPNLPKTPAMSPHSDRQSESFGEDADEFQKYVGQTAILTLEQFKKLKGSIPYRFQSLNWRLLYSTLRDGISLKTFYEKTYNCGPTLLVVQDVEHNVGFQVIKSQYHVLSIYI
eukprot:TRINITY_DN5313_c0_g3_i4.p1 TRINITY_DN5313_c0_g3~~TRINITY_DN5313_c0_g3_i4.p1  ORF type:complete len:400 (-),score=76.89 TRINITY_DN5313_c0_g3_i4:472-1671(-)